MGIFGFLPSLKTLETVFDTSASNDQSKSVAGSGSPGDLDNTAGGRYDLHGNHLELPKHGSTLSAQGAPQLNGDGYIEAADSGDQSLPQEMDPLSNVILRRATTDQSPHPQHHHSFSHVIQYPTEPSVDNSDVASPVSPSGAAHDPFRRSGSGMAAGSEANAGVTGTISRGDLSSISSQPNDDRVLGRSITTVNTPYRALDQNSQQTLEFPSIKRNPSKPGFFFRLRKSDGRPTIEDEEDVDFSSDRRDEGWKADVVGYVPNLPSAPKYIHVRTHKKQKREFNRVFLAQELKPPESDAPLDQLASAKKRYGVWCAKFSKDGRYLAVAGEDAVVRIWQVLSWPQDRSSSTPTDGENELNTSDNQTFSASQNSHISNGNYGPANGIGKSKSVPGDYAPVFKPVPVREFFGHSADVLDLSWSKNNFLLSSSMDKTVRLWHVDRSACLGSFLHSDFVTCIQFHPNDDRFFLSGSLDSKLRLWSIPDRQAAYEAKVPDLITAMAFSPNGTIAVAGCFGGQCFFYETDGLKYQTQMHVRSSRGKNSSGSKVTGIEVFQVPSAVRYAVGGTTFDNNVKLLISTNDSRIRIYNFFDRTLEYKFKGHENEQSQIKASFSDNGQYIISGSEDDRTYIWNVQESARESAKKKKERQEYEYFHSNKSMVTVALFAPTLTRRILAASGDPVYQVCDPPPVRLSPYGPEFENTHINPSSYLSSSQLQRMSSSERIANQKFPPLKPETNRAQHNDGNIIVTADRDGVIKIFRQDCAFEARKLLSDTASIMQRKRMSGLGLSPTHSWRDSFSIHRSRSVKAPSVRAGSPRPHQQKFDDQPPIPLLNNTSTTNSTALKRGRKPRAGSLTLNPTQSDSLRRDLTRPSAGSLSRATEAGAGLVLTSDMNSGTSTSHSSASNTLAAPDRVIECNNCSGTSFKARKVGNTMQLVCSGCMSPQTN